MISLWADHANTRGVVVMMRLAKMRLGAGRSPAPFYRAAGQHLARLRRGRTKDKWGKIVRDECGLGVARAYELMALGQGKTLAEVRAACSARTKKTRSRKALARQNRSLRTANRQSGVRV